MPNFTKEQMREIMGVQSNIRNLSIIAHIDHGKSTLTDSLLQHAGIMSKAKAGTMKGRETDTRKDEQERGITIKSTGVSMYFKYKSIKDDLAVEQTEETTETKTETTEEEVEISKDAYLINLIDSPGHVDFSSEVTAALRVTDGAIVVVDCMEGVCVQTETVLRQAISEKVRPILFLNKLDRVFLEVKLEPHDVYLRLRKTIESVNAILGTYEDEDLGDLQLDPVSGRVAFGSGYHQWAFTLKHFARMYAPQFNKTPKEMMKFLWGEYYYNNETKKWSKNSENGKHDIGFVKLIIKPIRNLIEAIMTNKKAKDGTPVYLKMLTKLNVKISKEDMELTDKKLVKAVMRTWLPASDTLLQMSVDHLPSPVQAQAYRTKYLYTGPQDDVCAEAMKKCDPNGPLMMYISKMIPTDVGSGRFYAFGRVFSGTVTSGKKYKIMGANYEHGNKRDLYEGKSVQRVVTMMGAKTDQMVDVPCGNTCAIIGIDNYLLKTGTISSEEEAYPVRDMKYAVAPVVRRSVSTMSAGDLPKLVEGLKRLAKSDPLVEIYQDEETGEHIVAGAGELHLEICLSDLEDFMKGTKLRINEPVVSYRETITEAFESTILTKSPNNHNRLFVTAEPMPQRLQDEIEEGKISVDNRENKEQARYLQTEFDYSVDRMGKRLWALGPDSKGANMFVDDTKAVDYLIEIKESVKSGFGWATRSGPLCGEPLRGVRINLQDVTLHADAIHRGMGQILPTTRRVVCGAVLTGKPRLMEPMYKCTITVPESSAGSVYGLVSNRRGIIEEDAYDDSGIRKIITTSLPVAESFGFEAELKSTTGGKGFTTLTFSHWKIINSDPLEEGSMANNIVNKIRERKGLGPMLGIERYTDRL
jgi:elongation factor 2